MEVRGAEHRPGTSASSKESFIKGHAEKRGHDIHPNYVEFLGTGLNESQVKAIFWKSGTLQFIKT